MDLVCGAEAVCCRRTCSFQACPAVVELLAASGSKSVHPCLRLSPARVGCLLPRRLRVRASPQAPRKGLHILCSRTGWRVGGPDSQPSEADASPAAELDVHPGPQLVSGWHETSDGFTGASSSDAAQWQARDSIALDHGVWTISR